MRPLHNQNPSINKMYNDEVAWVYFNFGDRALRPRHCATRILVVSSAAQCRGRCYTPSVKPALLPANAIYAILCLPAFMGSWNEGTVPKTWIARPIDGSLCGISGTATLVPPDGYAACRPAADEPNRC